MQSNEIGAGVVPEPAEMPDSESGFDQDTESRGEPSAGETTERQPAWRPGDDRAGQDVYEAQPVEDGADDAEAEGRGI